ncbi:MAG: NAD(P)H-dependent glycerol-3-phosphate dehydrogenase [Candidatus Zixiibacteriota bacterium]
MSENISVLGAGSWGIAISNLLCSNGHNVTLWEFNKADYEQLIGLRSHSKKLPGITIPDSIHITNDLELAANSAGIIVLASPAQTIRSVCIPLNDIIKDQKYFINLAKGVEIGTLMRMSEIIFECIKSVSPDNIATLSGPSHAEEVSRGVPTSIVAASVNNDFAERIQQIFSNKFFRVYRSSDVVGVELGGSLKNVVAIASGITQGLNYGDNTSGALLTRGLAEISRMGQKLGADPLTFSGLSGIGDLITTCLSRHSRNRHVGERIGKGEKLNDILDSMVMVAEGVATCKSANAMAEKYEVEMPITTEAYKVLFEDKPPDEAVLDLMSRTLKEEIWN